MKIVLAPDSFKNCLRSPAVCAALARGVRAAAPNGQIVSIPLADGGEGTVEAVVAATGGSLENFQAHGPLMRPVRAAWGRVGGGRGAVMEMAAASGLELLAPDGLDPLNATSHGAGELLAHILDSNIDEVLLGIGGSATVDGGAGFLQALGFKLIDAGGKILPPGVGGGVLDRVARVDASGAHPRLSSCRLRVACDVTNPLLGPNGAAAVFAPQKGADASAVALLEKNLAHWREVLARGGWPDPAVSPGDGAAGGLGFALRAVCGGRMASGAGLVMDLADLDGHLRGADLLVTGEGRTDAQSAGGKLCGEAARRAGRVGVPTVLVSGAISPGHGLESVFAASFALPRGPCSLEEAMQDAAVNLEAAGRNIVGLFLAAR